jgi:hypothetical protein
MDGSRRASAPHPDARVPPPMSTRMPPPRRRGPARPRLPGGRTVHRATSPLLRSDFAQSPARRSRAPTSRTVLVPTDGRAVPPTCATDISRVCAAPAEDRWPARKTRAGGAVPGAPTGRNGRRSFAWWSRWCERSRMSALGTPSGQRTWMPTAARTRAVRSPCPMALRPSPARTAVDERRAPEAAARGRGRARKGRTPHPVDGARRDVRGVPRAAHESERSRGGPADRRDESPATTRQPRSIAWRPAPGRRFALARSAPTSSAVFGSSDVGSSPMVGDARYLELRSAPPRHSWRGTNPRAIRLDRRHIGGRTLGDSFALGSRPFRPSREQPSGGTRKASDVDP